MEQPVSDATTFLSIRVSNAGNEELTLRLEPWGDHFVLSPATEVRIEASGPAGETLEFAVSPSAVTVFGWPGASIAVFSAEQGLETDRSYRPSSRQPQGDTL